MKAAIKGIFSDIKEDQIDIILSVDMLAGKRNSIKRVCY